MANRGSKIQSCSSIDQWRYVPSGDNPADCARRGVYPSKLGQHSLWWLGPAFLKKCSTEWPVPTVVSQTAEESHTSSYGVRGKLVAFNYM